MYKIYIDEDVTKTIYIPTDKTYTLNNIEIELELGEAGSLKFDIYKTNPYFTQLTPHKTFVTVLKDGERIFDGQIRETEKNIDGSMNVYAVGELAFLYDTIQFPAEWHGSPENYFRSLMQIHNNTVLGTITPFYYVGTVDIEDEYIYRFAGYQPTIEVIREDLLEPFGVYMKIRHEDAEHRYIDLLPLEEYGRANNQVIEFGLNLMDYVESESTDELYTAVLPLGRKKYAFERDSHDVPALAAYITVEEVNTTPYIKNTSAVNQYGYACAVVEFDDIDIPETLRKKGVEWLNQAQYSKLSLTLKAIDLSMLHSSYDDFRIGDMVRCIAEPFGVDITLPVTQMNIYPQAPENNVLTIGAATPSLTKQTADIGEEQAESNESNIIDWTYRPDFRYLVDWRGPDDIIGPNLFFKDYIDGASAKQGARTLTPVYFKTDDHDGNYHDYELSVGSLPDFTAFLTYTVNTNNNFDLPFYFESKYEEYDGEESTAREIVAMWNGYPETHEQVAALRLFDGQPLELRAAPTSADNLLRVESLKAYYRINTLPWYSYDYENGVWLDGTANKYGTNRAIMQGDSIIKATLPWDDYENTPGALYARFVISIHSMAEFVLVDQSSNYIVDENGNRLGFGPYTAEDNDPAISVSFGDVTRTLTYGELSTKKQHITIDFSEANLSDTLGPEELNTYIQYVTIRNYAPYPIIIEDFHLYGDANTFNNNPWARLWAF